VKHAYFLVLPNLHMLDLAGPLQIIATLKEVGIADVDVECIGPQRAVQSFQNVMLREIQPLPLRLRSTDALFVIGSKLDTALMASASWREAVAWLSERVVASADGPLVGSICTGTFLLAQAGLLDGRFCTTHHRFMQQLRTGFPAVHVLDNRVCVRDGNIWSSAGVASGIDLALQVVAQEFGEGAAIRVARENSVHLRRFGAYFGERDHSFRSS
jgi:transcriptional regulator GlxA family with amidase domain